MSDQRRCWDTVLLDVVDLWRVRGQPTGRARPKVVEGRRFGRGGRLGRNVTEFWVDIRTLRYVVGGQIAQ